MSLRSIEVTVRIGCPVACEYCPQDKLLAVEKPCIMLENNLQTIINNASYPNEKITIHFSGFTEPLSHPKLENLISICENHKNVEEIILYSTGWKLTSEKIDILSKFKKLTKVNFHVISKKYKNNNFKNFSNLLHLIHKLPSVTFIGVAFEENEFQEEFKEIKLNNLKTIFQPIISRSSNITEVDGQILNLLKVKHPITCIKLTSKKSPVVLPNGETMACCNDYGCELKIGNLISQKWHELNFNWIDEIQKNPLKNSNFLCFRDCHFAKARKIKNL